MKTLKFLFVSVICFFLQGCPGEPEPVILYKFELMNSSNEDIYIYSSNSGDPVGLESFPNSPSIVTQKGVKWNYPITEYPFNKGVKLWILVFKKSTLENNTWQQIRDNNLYDKRYSFNLEEMRAINFQVVYDGN
jgi:hypothetical protein